jgi:nucleoside-diphosphate-sugar epimerase
MRVLVIGGTEFISAHLVRALLRERHEVALVNRGRSPARVPAGVRTIVADRLDHAALRRALAGEQADALVDVTYAPTTGADVEAALEALAGRVGRVLFVSTGRVYDHGRPLPFDETTPRTLYWGEYAKNKIEGEDACLRRHRGHPAAAGEAYNVTGEEAITQAGFVEMIADVLKRPLALVPCPARLPDGRPVPFGQNLLYDCHAVYTTTKVRHELGVRPRYTLAAGLAQTYEWYLREELDRRPVDFTVEDAMLRRAG